ncbi:MAG: SIS domain-containing protein [Oscillospiraceae bacterium]|jgi:KpsF/GutQ family protein|nr:SIS domain-containing protein [Oscillospiraceae bacterium]
MSGDVVWAQVRRALGVESAAIAALPDTLDQAAICAAAEAIAACKGRIVLSGCGTSGAVAVKIAHTLRCIERPALYLAPSDAIHGGLGALQGGDILILISKGGNTRELAVMMPAAKAKGVPIIAVTENADGIIANGAAITLPVKVDREPCPFNMLATASSLAVIAVFDAICVAIMRETGYTREQFAVIHPGGAVGERLLASDQDRRSGV